MIPRHDESAAPADAATNSAAARFFRVLGDPTRLEILGLLLQRPHTVGELVAATGAAQPKVSNHLACLKWCRFVDAERDGRHISYTIADAHIAAVLATASDAISG
ncbi:MAG: ArsR/SmtB family transcription factor [Actinomycetota bacterium]